MAIQLTSTQADRYKWWVFGVVSIGLFMVVLDASGMNVALPSVARDFNTDLPTVQWVVLGHNLVVTALLLPLGRLADLIGRKRIYVGGMLFYFAGAALGTFAPSLPIVVIAKALQGVGAATVVVNTFAIVLTVFPASERGKVMGLNFVVLGIGAVSGPIVGGSLVEAFGWRSIFAMNLPVILLAVIFAALLLDESRVSVMRQDGPRPSFDWVGAALSTVAFVIFLSAMTGGQQLGWDSPYVLAALFAAAALMAVFIRWELRTYDPLLDLRLFKRKDFSIPVFAGFVSFLGSVSILFLMPFYLQRVLEYSPRESGLIMAPTAVVMGITGPIAGRIVDRYGTRGISIFGMAVFMAAALLFSRITVSTPLPYILAAVAVTGLATGAFQPPNGTAIVTAVDRAHLGMSNALYNLIRTAAWVIGIVLVTTVVTATMEARGYEPTFEAIAADGSDGVGRAFTEGARYVYRGLAGLMAIALIAVVLNRHQAVREADPVPASTTDATPTPAND